MASTKNELAKARTSFQPTNALLLIRLCALILLATVAHHPVFKHKPLLRKNGVLVDLQVFIPSNGLQDVPMGNEAVTDERTLGNVTDASILATRNVKNSGPVWHKEWQLASGLY